ncbi:MAG TPA: SAM-dependent methyltransferase, partial [Spirochaetia bacterium]|nr:SAM-dependent methyltransferase [Spirochaetia bacterium]
MEAERKPVSVADTSQPNAGRIYDFLLGGNHNFEIDRITAEGLIKAVPTMPQWVRLIRWFLNEAVHRLVEEGFTCFIDFASGLPTVDHIHHMVPR